MKTAALFTIAFLLGAAGLSACGRQAGVVERGAQTFGDGRDVTAAGIVGGTKASPKTAFAHAVVAIEFRRPGQEPERCSGVVISPRAVLTAAHCASVEANQLSILFPRGPEMTALQRVPVLRVAVHPGYAARAAEIVALKQWDQGNQFDAAVLLFDEAAAPSAVALPLASVNASPDAVYFAAGFGAQSFDMRSGQRVGGDALQPLLTVALQTAASSQDGILLFIQSRGSGICLGDSGGPAIIEDPSMGQVIYGIATSVRNPGRADACAGESRFVSVTKLQLWIDSVSK